MRKALRKMMALVIAMVMVLAMSVSVFAESSASGGDLNSDDTLTVTGLEEGDTVKYYQVLEWDADSETGWVFTSDYSSLTDDDLNEILNTGINTAMANKIGAAATTAVTDPAPADVADNQWVQTVTKPGLYMVAITSVKEGIVYNPVFVAADFYRDEDDQNDTDTWNVTTALSYEDTAMAKKSEIPLTKTAAGDEDTSNPLNDAEPNTADVGEVIDFTVATTIPLYADNYTNPVFKVQDTLVGMTLDQNSIVVKTAAGTTLTPAASPTGHYAVEKSDTGYTITFNTEYIKSLTVATDIVITYKAEVTDEAEAIINQDKNTVVVKYSNGPEDTTGAGRKKDETNHFTFSIDANLLGPDGKPSSEAVKVGLDSEGNPIEDVIETYESGESHAALDGAVFKLYTAESCGDDDLYTNDLFDGTVTTGPDGLLTIKGLDAGNYWLKEISAPKGYIKAQDPIPVVISATIEDEEVTETVDGIEVTYTTNKLTAYSVTVGGSTTTYTITNDDEKDVEVTAAERTDDSEDGEIVNTKGSELPATGGIGTTLFYLIGTILVLGAGILLVTRRRMRAR